MEGSKLPWPAAWAVVVLARSFRVPESHSPSNAEQGSTAQGKRCVRQYTVLQHSAQHMVPAALHQPQGASSPSCVLQTPQPLPFLLGPTPRFQCHSASSGWEVLGGDQRPKPGTTKRAENFSACQVNGFLKYHWEKVLLFSKCLMHHLSPMALLSPAARSKWCWEFLLRDQDNFCTKLLPGLAILGTQTLCKRRMFLVDVKGHSFPMERFVH